MGPGRRREVSLVATLAIVFLACSTSGDVRGLEDRRLDQKPPRDPLNHEAFLTRTKKPRYPVALRNRGEEGFVLLRIRVASTGVVEEPEVLFPYPHDEFNESAVAAELQWQYEPKVVDGSPVESTKKTLVTFCVEPNLVVGKQRPKPCLGEEQYREVFDVLMERFAD